MSPVIFQIGPLAIRWYGVMVALSVLLGVWLTYRYGDRLGVPREMIDRLSTGLIVMIFVGARLGYVVTHPGEFAGNPLEIIRVDHGGLSSHGIYVAGLLYLWWFSRRAGADLWRITDAIAPGILVANVLVRIGNLMNGELYGDPTSLPWGVVFPGAGPLPRHPLQIYEILTSLASLVVIHRLTRRRTFPGQVFWTTLVLMSAVRFGLDLLRSDDHVLGPLALGNVAAAIVLLVGGWFLWTKPTAKGPGTRDQGPAAPSEGPIA